MKAQEIRQLTPKKIQEELEKTQRSLLAARFHVRTGQNQNIAQIAKLKKSVARMKTLLSQPSFQKTVSVPLETASPKIKK